MSNIVLSFLALFAGIMSLFADVKESRGRRFAGILALILLATFGVQIHQHNQEEHKIEGLVDSVDKLTSAFSDFRNKNDNSDESQQRKSLNITFGSTQKNPTKESLEKSIEADQVRTQLAKSTNPSQRNQVTIQYFPKNVDGNIVKSSLKELGFKIRLGTPGIPDVPTNAIFYDPNNVSIDNVKLVALTLIRAGVEIKHIRPFRNSNGRSSLIQVGSGTAYVSRPPYSVEAIQQATSFPL